MIQKKRFSDFEDGQFCGVYYNGDGDSDEIYFRNVDISETRFKINEEEDNEEVVDGINICLNCEPHSYSFLRINLTAEEALTIAQEIVSLLGEIKQKEGGNK